MARRGGKAAKHELRASDYPAPYRSSTAIGGFTDPADERIDVGVLIVGAGPAGLACAIRLGQLLEQRPDIAEQLGEVPVAIVDKMGSWGIMQTAAVTCNSVCVPIEVYRRRAVPSHVEILQQSEIQNTAALKHTIQTM